MRSIHLTATVAWTLLLAGCATPAAPPAPATTAPPQWYGRLPHQGRLSDLTLWWQQFNDPLRVQLIESAQTASPTVARARSRIVQARATRAATSAALLPTLDAQASAVRGNTQLAAPLATTLQAGVQAL